MIVPLRYWEDANYIVPEDSVPDESRAPPGGGDRQTTDYTYLGLQKV